MSAEPTLFDWSPGRFRAGDYATSVAGAKSVAYRAGSQKAKLLAAYEAAGDEGLTAYEAALRADVSLTSCYWKRCGELRADGKIVDTGHTRPGPAGDPQIVCVVAS